MESAEAPMERLLSVARQQYSLLTVDQLQRAGFAAQRRRRLVRKGWITPVFPGVYRLAGVAPTWRGTAKAATLAAGPSAVLSHRSALALWELIDPERLEGSLELICPRQVRFSGITAHRHAIDPRQMTTLHRIPVTRIERTIFDVAEGMPSRQVGHLIDDALRANLTSVGNLAQMVAKRTPRSFRAALHSRGVGCAPAANDWEADMDRMWDLMGLPPAERQAWVVLPGGWRFKPDRMIRSVKLAVEWDGDEHHGRRSDFERDIERRNRFVAAGWTVLDFHWHQSQREICSTVLQVFRRLASTKVPAS
jgi:hypothetical protein